MPLIEELPPSVEATLRQERNGHGDEPPALAVKADIGKDGNLGERWVVVDAEMVRVLTPNGTRAHVDVEVPLSDIAFARTENLVGGGALAVGKGTDAVELVRFTTPLQGRMGSVARTIEALAKDEEPPVVSLDDDKRVCKKCGRPLREKDDVCRACIDKRAVLGRLFAYAAPHKAKAVALVLLMFAGTAMTLAPGVIIKNLTDNVLLAENRTLSARHLLLGLLVLAFIGTQLAGVVLTVVRGRLSAWLSQTITYKLRTEVHQQLQRLGLSYYDKRQTGALMARVTQDVQELNHFLVDGLQILVVNGLTILGIVIVLLANNARLTLLVLLPVPLVIWATRRTWRFLWRRMHRMWHLRSSLSARLNASLSGARVVRAFAQEDREIDRFNKRATDLYEANLQVEQWWATIFPGLNFLMTAGMFIVWYVGGRQVIGDVITLGTLQMFLFFLGQLYGPLQGMTRIADWLSRALTSAERVFEVLDTEPDVKDEPGAVAMARIEGAIEFKNVSFGYDKSRRVLENFDLKVEPGEMIGLVGHSGAGKTTIINLLSRFYDPTEGVILVDGVEMRKIKVNDLRSQLGIVLQEPFLFPGTISENIAYAKPGAAPEEIMRAAKAANAHDFIMRFPDGYDTEVGERGTRLSGGERQRLSIARAILHDPRILILDEATASVDTETEKQIQEAIARLIQGRTTFAIAHRLSTLRNADRLIVMEKGGVVELGTHDELMANPEGKFRRLVEMQTEINKLRAL
uniref:Efflux ABC transporter, permease/ATP-binding protein n=1 Tax=uncultured Armatimonadetes bacterium TaxID=157466 RepID=A0A6J4JUA6_9BACT|nr:Efflux ABC transporter, permease/ATP-binding protein [uncultured Armatimonadetes bacterium]